MDDTGKLIFKFYVRPQTYAQLCRDQKNYIQNLEKNNASLSNQIAELYKISNKEAIVPEIPKNDFENNFNSKFHISDKVNETSSKENLNFMRNSNQNLKECFKAESKYNINGHSNNVKNEQNNLNLIKIEGNNDEKRDNNFNSIKNNNYKIKNGLSLESLNEKQLEDNSINYNDKDVVLKRETQFLNKVKDNSENKFDKEYHEKDKIENNNPFNSERKINRNMNVNSPKNLINANNNKIINQEKSNDLSKIKNIFEENLQTDNDTNIIINNRSITDKIDNEDKNIKLQDNSKNKNHRINSINTLTVSCENINDFSEKFNKSNLQPLNKDNNINSNKFKLLNDICESNNPQKSNNVNKIDHLNNNNNFFLNSQREKLNNFSLSKNISNYQSSDKTYQCSQISNDKNGKEYNFNYKTNQNLINNASNNLDNNNNNTNDNNSQNKYSKIANNNNTNLNSNITSMNFNYKTSNQNNSQIGNSHNNNNNNNNSNDNSNNNFVKGKLNINSNNSELNNNAIQITNTILENEIKRNKENYNNNNNKKNLINEFNNDIRNDQYTKLNNLRQSVDNPGNLAIKQDRSNTNKNDIKDEIKKINNLDFSSELKVNEKELFLNTSEIKINKGTDEKDSSNFNEFISLPKSENFEIENNDPIIITEINYKDLINKKVKNKLLKCEKLLNEIKVKDDIEKVLNNENVNNRNNINNICNSISSLNNVNDNNKNNKLKSFKNLQDKQQSIEKDLFFNPLDINEKNSNLNKNLILDISENFIEDNDLNGI